MHGALSQDGDVYPDWPQDLDEKDHDIHWWLNAVAALKAAGAQHFKVCRQPRACPGAPQVTLFPPLQAE